ncbi:MAG: BamA/TamA family outer membrane protein [Myxococcales bacterium]|nr:BamA/TamA family outer membrane protein [Polyangiaceae bacterium]MDW8249068.1 BamA/TamA family outer membrane protein [Myxococcales bacterium]
MVEQHFRFWLLLGMLASGVGCATRPTNRPVVTSFEVRGTRQLSPEEILDRLATRATATTLGFTLQYETYDRFVLERDLHRIERHYRARGFYDARVQAGRVEQDSGGNVQIEVLVEEGKPTQVGMIRLDILGEINPQASVALARAQTLKPGDRFEEEPFVEVQRRILRALSDTGYARARLIGGFSEADLVPEGEHPRVIDPSVEDPEEELRIRELLRKQQQVQEQGEGRRRYSVRIDPVRHTADLYLKIDPGPLCTFGAITLVEPDGKPLRSLPEQRIRRALGIAPGEVYSTARLESVRRALLELGVFSSVEYDSNPEGSESTAIPVIFKVTPAPLRTVTLGGGLQADVLQTDVHFFAGYDHQNFLGGLRRLTMQVRPGTVLFPTNLQNLLPPERALPEIRARAELRQPQIFGGRTRGTLRSEFLVYPFLLPARNSAEVPDVVVGYREIREAAGLDRTFLKGKLALQGFYNFQLSYPFSYVGPLDEGIQRVFLSYLSLVQALDLRDNPIKPRLGVYLTNEIQIAGTPTAWFFQSDAHDFKIQPDARFYAPVSRRLVVATRASVGFLFPFSYGATLEQQSPDRTIDPIGALVFEEARNRDLQLLFFRAFFSGGPTSNRGYPLRGVGPRGIAPFRLSGSTALRDCVGRIPARSGVAGAASQVARLPAVDPQICSVSLGGLSLWEWSGELRFLLTERVGVLLFLDASDVTRQRFTLRLGYLHLTAGTGLRLDTPVGPVRLDVGYAIPKLQRIGSELDPTTEGLPATFLGAPIALNIAVGEAF